MQYSLLIVLSFFIAFRYCYRRFGRSKSFSHVCPIVGFFCLRFRRSIAAQTHGIPPSTICCTPCAFPIVCRVASTESSPIASQTSKYHIAKGFAAGFFAPFFKGRVATARRTPCFTKSTRFLYVLSFQFVSKRSSTPVSV